jgi:hypothetical protein
MITPDPSEFSTRARGTPPALGSHLSGHKLDLAAQHPADGLPLEWLQTQAIGACRGRAAAQRRGGHDAVGQH